ncbi:MAG: type IX secretion system membrane protein PorP/SprF [Flavobacteriales bacterium]
MKMFRYILATLLLASAAGAKAQQDPMYSQYMFNMLTVNPAYAGSADVMTANAIYRHQWVEFDGAPRTQTVTLHAPLRRESISVGGSIINDSHSVIRTTGLHGDVSYRIFFDRSKLAFGLKAGINLLQANLLDLNPVDGNDPVFQQNISNRTMPNFGAGMLWYSEKHYVGVSMPRLLNNKLTDASLPSLNDNRERRHLFLTAGFLIDVNNYIQFKPATMIRLVNGAPPSFDVTGNFLFYQRFWAGAMYRYQESVGMLFQYVINNKLRVGYAYDFTVNDIRAYSSGSHEIMLGLDIGRSPGAEVSPRFF